MTQKKFALQMTQFKIIFVMYYYLGICTMYHFKIERGAKKKEFPTGNNKLSIKNPQFFPNPYEI